jgi:hypothetical protein
MDPDHRPLSVHRPGRVYLSRVLLIAAAASGLSACALQFNTRRLGVPVTMAAPQAQVAPGDSFRVRTRALYLLWGLASLHQPDLRQALAGQLGTGTGVANLSISAVKRWPDLLLTVLTAGVVTSTTVTFEGVVTRGGP